MSDKEESATTSSDSYGPVPRAVLEDAVENLAKGLHEGNMNLIEDALSKLGVTQERDLYDQIGTMTRRLHEALREFRQSMSPDAVTMHTTNLPDATDKLAQVIDMTREAADKTLTACEQIDDNIEKHRESLQAAISDGTIDKNWLEKQLHFLESYEQSNSDILMSQTFQDLSGQALQKVIKLVSEVENNLISILQVFGGNEEPKETEIVEANNDNEDINQDDADALLKSFGF